MKGVFLAYYFYANTIIPLTTCTHWFVSRSLRTYLAQFKLREKTVKTFFRVTYWSRLIIVTWHENVHQMLEAWHQFALLSINNISIEFHDEPPTALNSLFVSDGSRYPIAFILRLNFEKPQFIPAIKIELHHWSNFVACKKFSYRNVNKDTANIFLKKNTQSKTSCSYWCRTIFTPPIGSSNHKKITIILFSYFCIEA